MRDERQALIDAYFDGTATAEMLAELDRALREDEALRVEFLQTANLIAELNLVLCPEEESEVPVAEVRPIRAK